MVGESPVEVRSSCHSRWSMRLLLALLLLLLGSAHSAPVQTLFPQKSVGSSPIQLDPVEASGDAPLSPDPSLLSPLDDNRVDLLEVNTAELSPLSDLIEPALDKWWCGNNTASRGLAHAIARMDNDIQGGSAVCRSCTGQLISSGINNCCRVHDYEYDEARTFEEVQRADADFDECLARETSLCVCPGSESTTSFSDIEPILFDLCTTRPSISTMRTKNSKANSSRPFLEVTGILISSEQIH